MRLLAALAPAALLLVLGLCGKAAAAYLVPPVTPFNGWEPDWHSVLERSFFAHADLFAFGMAVAVLSVEVGSGRIRFGRGARIAASGLAIGAYLVTARMTYVNEQLSYSPYNTLMALGCAALLALVVLPLPSGRTSPLARLLETRALVAAGIVSYSVFLWHYPLALWLKEQGLTVSGPSGFVVNVLVLAVATLALSVLTYRLVERPALRRKRPAEQPTPPALAAVPEPTL